MGVATGCGCKEVHRFPHILIPTPLVSVLFAAVSLHFVHFVKCFSYFFVITFYILNNFFTQYNYGRPTAAV